MKSEGTAKMIDESYPEKLVNGELLGALLLSYFLKSDTEAGTSAGELTEIETAIREYYHYVLEGCELSFVALKARDPHAEKIIDRFVEPIRMFVILHLTGAVRECRGFSSMLDPLYLAATFAAKLRLGRTHLEDFDSFNRLLESDAKESGARFFVALADVLRKKNGDMPTYLRLRYTIFFRVMSGRWPTCAESPSHLRPKRKCSKQKSERKSLLFFGGC